MNRVKVFSVSESINKTETRQFSCSGKDFEKMSKVKQKQVLVHLKNFPEITAGSRPLTSKTFKKKAEIPMQILCLFSLLLTFIIETSLQEGFYITL